MPYGLPDLVLLLVIGITQIEMLTEITQRLTEITQKPTEITQNKM